MKKVIVTGANGFIGKYLVKYLLEQNVYVIGIDKEENINNVTQSTKYYNIKLHLDELDKLKEYSELENADVIYHLAWNGSAGDKRADYELQIENIKYTCKVVEMAQQLGCKRFVGIGSVTELMYRDYIPSDYSTPENVASYAVGKIGAEYFSKILCNKLNIDYIWTYIANIYGLGGNAANIVEYLIRCYGNKQIPELTKGEQLADFIFVSDVARALHLIGEKGESNVSYYVGYGSPRPLKEYVEIVRDLVNVEMDTGLGRKKFNGNSINFEKIDYRKIHDELGFFPHISFELGIGKMIDDLRKRGIIS